MATPTRLLRPQCLAYTLLRPAYQRWQSTFSHLESELKSRKISPIFDDLTPQTSHRLSITLSDFLPSSHSPPSILAPAKPNPPMLPLPHHLVYFEPTKRSSEMLPDGTNPDQSPGDPFVRRMWAGGRVRYNHSNPFVLDGGRGVCAEFIRSVSVKGREGEEKVFVSIERRQAKASAEEVEMAEQARLGEEGVKETLEHRVRQRLWRDGEEDFGVCSVVETRNIVFMRERSKAEAEEQTRRAKGKELRPQQKADWKHTMVPDAKLLFRFSALTFNAHAIHLDPEYCREVEGHRTLLFHGPLSYVFMITLLQQRLREAGEEVVKSVEYRNLAPLYAHEPVTFCGTRTGEGRWEIWTETPEGGVAVKGSVVTEGGK
ncbi:uncharacterized protein LTR77_008483 [Saxophila tyrrhenica]|uniref:Uncharacterized protein n=1 Tax=Saxophila tyrrhenica TaxID=1690608 RepID=A0AAV9P126_9PEZI|nr:hypothetical protein LTR77_008483 [Saxophila tyrrhenica]